MQLRLHEIYLSTEGEGIHLGAPQVFVRFQGCCVGCRNCDSKETWNFRQGLLLDLPQVVGAVEQVDASSCKRVSLTGGDPLHPNNLPAARSLGRALKEKNYWINLEAAGTKWDERLFDTVDFIGLDIKTPSTGVRARWDILLDVIPRYSSKLQIKAVVDDWEDFHYLTLAYQWLRQRPSLSMLQHVPFVITPGISIESPFSQKKFQNILAWNERAQAPFRVIGQQHKWAFGPYRRGV